MKDSRDLARSVGAMAPGSQVKLDVLHKGETRTLTLTLGEMPNDRQANGAESNRRRRRLARRISVSALAPASEVDGAGEKGVVVTSVDPDGTAAEHGVQTGDVILNVGGKAVSNVGDVRSALSNATSNGKHSVLMQVKTADATRFIAVPLNKG